MPNKPWQSTDLLADPWHLDYGIWYRTEYYADDHMLHRDSAPGLEAIAWCGRPLCFDDLGAYTWSKRPKGWFKLDHRLYFSKRTSSNARCSECRSREKDAIKSSEDWMKVMERAKKAKW